MRSSITPPEFERLRDVARGCFGLDLKPGKESLAHARLSGRMAQLGCDRLTDYLDQVQRDPTGHELTLLAEALTTNYTSFLREHGHFEFLRENVLPQLAQRAELRFWCAACSTGEEAYTLLFTSLDIHPTPAVRILATDISVKSLEQAVDGIYGAARAAILPRNWKLRYLQQGLGRWEGHVRVKSAFRDAIRFRRLNLVDSFGQLPLFPVIFCRNVMIYFDRVAQATLVQKLSERLEPGGYLLIGHAEGFLPEPADLEYVMPATYRKPGQLR